jgi:preprotein translocase subunit YajC
MPKMSLLASPFVLAQAPAVAPATPSLVSFLWMPLALGAMYFFMIAPQRKKQKEHDKMLKALKSGDEVVTNGGIFGTITNVKDDRFVLKISDTTKIELAKGFIQSVINRGDAEEKK